MAKGNNQPFNMSDWSGETLGQDMRWELGIAPVESAVTAVRVQIVKDVKGQKK
jgi:hypothetical protein